MRVPEAKLIEFQVQEIAIGEGQFEEPEEYCPPPFMIAYPMMDEVL